jgi:hypothetical protein
MRRLRRTVHRSGGKHCEQPARNFRKARNGAALPAVAQKKSGHGSVTLRSERRFRAAGVGDSQCIQRQRYLPAELHKRIV